MADQELGTLSVVVTADTKPLETSLKGVRAEAERFATTTRSASNTVATSFRRDMVSSSREIDGFSRSLNTARERSVTFATSLKGLSATVGTLFGAAVVQGSLNLIRAYEQQERQILTLRAQFKLLGVDVNATMKDLDRFNEQLQKLTGLDDDVIRGAESIGVRFGLVGDSLKQVTLLAADFASVSGEELPQAMLTLARITDEPVSALLRLKRVLPIDAETERLVKAFDQVGDRTSAANTLFQALQKQLEGFAASTNVGITKSMRDLDNVLDDLGKTLAGSFVGPRMVAFLEEFNKRLTTTGKEIGIIVDAFEKLQYKLGLAPAKDPFADQPKTVNELADALERIHQERLAGHPIKLDLPASEVKGLTDATKDAQRAADDYRDSLDDLHFQLNTIGLTYEQLAAAQKAHELFGAEWANHLDDSAVGLAGLNSQLETSLGLAQDFGSHFVDVLVDGKDATLALNDALKDVERQVLQMAIQKSIGAAFNLAVGGLTGGGGGGGVSGGVFQTGGYVGSTPVPPIHKHGKLQYDEYPAILHVGERVIPAGGQQSGHVNVSGEQMLRMFGGIPKFQSGFNAGAAAAGAYTAGDTGATGAWSNVSGGGGNVTLSNLLASQYSGRGGGGPISLGSRGSGGGSVTLPALRPLTVPLPRLRPITVPLPLPRPDYHEPIIGTPLPPVLSNFGVPSDLVPFGSDFAKLWPDVGQITPGEYTDVESVGAPNRPARHTVAGISVGPDTGATTYTPHWFWNAGPVTHPAVPVVPIPFSTATPTPDTPLSPTGADVNYPSGAMPPVPFTPVFPSGDWRSVTGQPGMTREVQQLFSVSAHPEWGYGLGAGVPWAGAVNFDRFAPTAPTPSYRPTVGGQTGGENFTAPPAGYRPTVGGGTGGENFTFQPVTDWWNAMSLLPRSNWPAGRLPPPSYAPFGGWPRTDNVAVPTSQPAGDAFANPFDPFMPYATAGYGAAAGPPGMRGLMAFRTDPTANLANVSMRLQESIRRGSAYLPEGYSIEVTEGYVPKAVGGHVGHSQHYVKGAGAVDLWIRDPSGNLIPNKGADRTGMYGRLASGTRVEMLANYPDLAPYLRWGGTFGTSRRRGAPADLMHFDIRGAPVSLYHQGGWVGSTPAAIWQRAPRLHDGLAADEYPAILQAGERVIPRGGGGGGSTVNVVVNNNNGSQVGVEQSQDDQGNVRVDIMIDQLVAAKMRDGGSSINRTMASMGSRAVPVRR